jgi:hypothetical protein
MPNKHLTLEHAKALSYGETIYHRTLRNADGTPQRFRVNGKPKVWKRSPQRVQVPLKRGLWEYDYLTEDDLQDFSEDEETAMAE